MSSPHTCVLGFPEMVKIDDTSGIVQHLPAKESFSQFEQSTEISPLSIHEFTDKVGKGRQEGRNVSQTGNGAAVNPFPRSIPCHLRAWYWQEMGTEQSSAGLRGWQPGTVLGFYDDGLR